MARRPRKTLPRTIELQFNSSTGLYDGEENGITYHLTFSQMNDMKNHYRGSVGNSPTLIDWYNSLTRPEKKAIKRTGAPQQPDDFTPDREWDE